VADLTGQVADFTGIRSHSSVAFTMDTYSHIIEGMQEDAMALLDEVLPAGVSQINNAILTPITSIMVS